MESGDHPHCSETNPFRFQFDNMNTIIKDENMNVIDNVKAEETCTVNPGECSSAPHKSTTNSNSDEWYSDKLLEVGDCPFKRFHRAGLPSEFLQNPYYRDKRSRHILAGMNDHSNGIYMKIQFIVSSLKDCLGIWPQLFLQKLNAIIVHADHATVRIVLSKDNFTILRELIGYYVNEGKCNMVFRYWCFLYNALSRNLIPVLPSDLKNQIIAQLQKDFSLATQNQCRCKLDVQCNSEPDEEHTVIDSLTQNKITSILMYYVICKVGDHSNNTSDIYKETPPKVNGEKFFKGILVRFYIKLYERCNSEESVPALMEVLAHVLIAFHNIPYEKNLFASAIQVMLDMGYLSAATKVKDMLLNLFQNESETFQTGSGSKLAFTDPKIRIGFQTLGLSSVMKCMDGLISNVEYQILSRDEQFNLIHKMVAMQNYMGNSSFWNSEFENIYLYCRRLQCTLEKRLGFQMTDIKLDSDTETGTESGIQLSEQYAESSASSQTSQSKLQPSRSVSGDYDSERVDDWIVDTKNISKLRKGYEHEIKDIGTNTGGGQQESWISRWMSRVTEFILNCGKCCDVKQ